MRRAKPQPAPASQLLQEAAAGAAEHEKGEKMDRKSEVKSIVGIIITALLLTFGNGLMEAFFKALGI